MPVYVCSFKDSPKNKDLIIDTTSKSTKDWRVELSPFYLGPVSVYGRYISQNFENLWQFCKCYSRHIDSQNNPTSEYFKWAEDGWNNKRAIRYPMGKGAIPQYSYWNGHKYGYIEARKKIYCPIYASLVEKTSAFARLKKMYDAGDEIWLWDFDGYNHKALGMTYADVLNNPKRKAGHAFVLAMCLEGKKDWLLDI